MPVSIDVGFDDVVYPDRVSMEFPVLLDMGTPQIYAYSILSVISEKFEAIVSLGDANSRYKDFYDIYILSDRYDLDGRDLKESIRETFEHRETSFGDIYAFKDEFISSEVHQNRWKAFLRKKKALIEVEFDDVIKVLKELLNPIVVSIIQEKPYINKWNHVSKRWE